MCKGGQNNIDYIVYHNPDGSRGILNKFGYEPPSDNDELAQAMKQLVRRKGETAIKELMLIHPERKLLLEITGHNPDADESNFCGCHSSYTGELKDYLGNVSEMSDSDLSDLYEEAKIKSGQTPGDKLLMGQIETIWNELKRRKKNKEQTDKKTKDDSENKMLYLALAFLLGLMIAKIA